MTGVPVHPVFGSKFPDGWRLLTVDDVKSDEPSSCVAGPFGSNISKKYFVESGVPVIRGSNLTDDRRRFVSEGFVFVTEDRATSYVPQHVVAGDLVFTCWGTIGQVGLIPADGPYPAYVISNKQLKLRPHPEIADSVFLFYYFASDEAMRFVRNRAIGAAVPGINLGILKSLPVVLPAVELQRRIAAVLSMYDELIETNLRRIEILEEMAQAIYREWFVNLRYPGHEADDFVDSPLGPIPAGWRVVPAESAIDFNPRNRSPHGGTWTYISMSALALDSMVIGKPETRERPSGSRFRNGDTLLARITPSLENGKTGFVQFLEDGQTACGSTEFIVMRSRTLTPEWVYLFSRGDDFRMTAVNSMVGASGRQRVQEVAVRRFTFAHPPGALLSIFESLVKPMFALVQNLATQNANLREARDLLLPKLVSGEIDVSDLDIDTSWLVA